MSAASTKRQVQTIRDYVDNADYSPVGTFKGGVVVQASPDHYLGFILKGEPEAFTEFAAYAERLDLWNWVMGEEEQLGNRVTVVHLFRGDNS